MGFEVYGHRGSTLLAPENTVEAFELALGYRVDVLEIDVRLSRDGEVIVTHDERVDRTCNGQGKVAELSLKDLKKLDAGYHFVDLNGQHYRNQGVRLPTLSELFERFPTTRINIDIKDNSQKAALAVADCINRADKTTLTNVGSFHAEALAHFRKALPSVTTAATQSEVAKLYFGRQLVQSFDYQYLQIPVSFFALPLATRRFIQLAKSQGIGVVYWTVNEKESMQKLMSLGATGVVTDRPDLAMELLHPADAVHS